MSKMSKYFSTLLFMLVFIAFACKSNENVIEEETVTTTEAPTKTDGKTSEAPVVVEEVEAESPLPESSELEERDRGDAYDGAVGAPGPPPSRSKASSKVMMSDAAVTSSSVMVSRKGEPTPTRPVKPIDPEEVKDYTAGQLTAAEWNDLYNWDDWKDLLSNQDYNEMQEHWEIYPRTRYSVFLRNEYELPLQDIKIELLSKSGEVLWTAHTDNAGRAELWSDIHTKDKSFEDVDARYSVNGKPYKIKNLITIEEGVNHLDAKVECVTSYNVDIVFAVDATGSMGDEIRYLQSELKNVIERSAAANAKLSLRTGSVFYRDSTDEYLTRVQPLTKEVSETLAFIEEQSAGGGGDYPEAVDAALDDALAMDWSEDAVARIIFLLLDAPPHHDPEVLARLQSQVADAAKEGIKIIPITASGINRQTEFLMKFMAIATNGTYVFITDHSGIGNPHLDPVVQDYEVEKLNDLLVRLLYHYTKSNGCNANDPAVASGIKVYPNPASSFVHVTSDKEIEEIRVLSNTGKLMYTDENINSKERKLRLEGLVDGVYTIQCVGPAGAKETESIVVISGR